MKKKEAVDFITSISLIILACCVLLLPILKVSDLPMILYIIFGFYTAIKFTSFIITLKEHDYENFFTSIISLGALLAIYFIEIKTKNLALILLIWIGLMSLVKLKKADFYHDRQNRMWLLRIFILFIFIASGLLTSLNLLHDPSVQIIMLGFFFLINSILDAVDPLTSYLIRHNGDRNK